MKRIWFATNHAGVQLWRHNIVSDNISFARFNQVILIKKRSTTDLFRRSRRRQSAPTFHKLVTSSAD
jgi:hypothetical protein